MRVASKPPIRDYTPLHFILSMLDFPLLFKRKLKSNKSRRVSFPTDFYLFAFAYKFQILNGSL